METHAVVEHICLASDLVDMADDTRVTNKEFVQRVRWHGVTTFTVFNEHHISVDTRALRDRHRRYELDLSILGSQPRRVIRLDKRQLFAGLALVVAAGVFSLIDMNGTGWVIGVVLLSVGAVLLGVALWRSSDQLIFYSKHGRAPLLVLQKQPLDRAALQDFVSDISRRIKLTRGSWSGRRQFLSAELREHRRLYEQGVLSRSEYDRIKRLILKKH